VEGSGRGLILRNYPRHLSDGTRENHEKPQDSRSLGRNLKPRPPKYETGVLNTLLRRSVSGLFL
jgi:hypothetical protein